MDPYIWLRQQTIAILSKHYPQIMDDTLVREALLRIVIEPTRDPEHGDCALNAAMVLAKPLQCNPREIAGVLCDGLCAHEFILDAQIAGPGFVNLRLDHSVWVGVLQDILQKGQNFGDMDLGAGQLVNVEYVSANPTGPLHVGHTRGAVVGDALASLLAKAGYDVVREYYVNDAGNQIAILAQSVYRRYLQALGQDSAKIAEGLYPGEYLIALGQDLANSKGDSLCKLPLAEAIAIIEPYAVIEMMKLVRAGLEKIGVRHDVITHESTIVAKGQVEAAIAKLQDAGAVYSGVLEKPKGIDEQDWQPREQMLFRSTDHGDDQDRALQKSDGAWTYFAPDIAYHYDKYCRGFNRQIDVLGADHSGYAKRIQAATKVASGGDANVQILLCNIVRLLQGGQIAKMSKRAGTFVTLDDLVDAVGSDAIRFIMLTRRNDQTLDFDLDLVRAQTRDNPVFYVQYAHARTCSVFRRAGEMFTDWDLQGDWWHDIMPSQYSDQHYNVIKKLAEWPRVIEASVNVCEVHRIAQYLIETATAFHQLWTQGRDQATMRFLDENDRARSMANLALIYAVQQVLVSGLSMLGVSAPQEMQ